MKKAAVVNTLSALTLLSSSWLISETAFAAPITANPSISTWCASGKTVQFAGLNWASGAFLTEVMRNVLENGYGCKTDSLPGNSVAMEVALSKNDIQVFAEEWIGRSDAWNEAAKAGKVIGVGNLIVGAVEGWYVPEYVIKGDVARNIKPMAANLKSVTDLPKYKDLFKDEEEPSKGRFLSCPTGWTCSGINSQKLKAYGLTASYVNFRPGTGPALDAAVASAAQRGKPVLFYYWNPTALMGRYKFVKLEEPAFNQKCWDALSDQNNATPCGSAFPEVKIQVGLSKKFSDADPVLTAAFSKMNIPLATLNQYLSEQDVKKTDNKILA
ncbi:MAG: histidine ABC transporter substrate-binding protein, partial [Glaciimonas sp.]|nr:histidine ABC transporter substrate-binding protein [Glaciimonas sp.]